MQGYKCRGINAGAGGIYAGGINAGGINAGV